MFKCPDCGGDGKETCHNPDHSFIDMLSFHDIGRIGCPVCGHDPKHKVKGENPCETCCGSGQITLAQGKEFCGDGDWEDLMCRVDREFYQKLEILEAQTR